MNRKRKAGILLILIGIGIPLVLFFFQEDGELWLKQSEAIRIERRLTPREIEALEAEIESRRRLVTYPDSLMANEEEKIIEKHLREIKEIIRKDERYNEEFWWLTIEQSVSIPYKYSIGIGIILIFIGIGMIIFSFSPKKTTPKKKED